jgi:hypothetical protein
MKLYHYLKQLVIYTPAPIFFLFGVYSVIASQHNHMCGGSQWEMPLMWFLMSVSHLYPWIVYFEQQSCQHCGCSALDEIQKQDPSATN